MRAVDISKNERYVEIFKKLVEIYVETGEAVGSRTIAKQIESSLSPATVRNVMADLEGRKPTEKGWRFFVNTLVETASVSELEIDALESVVQNTKGKSLESILEQATGVLSELANCASLIRVPTVNSEVRHIDFVLLSPGRAIVVIVNENGVVENRLIDVAPGVSASVLEKATRYINTKLAGCSLKEIQIKLQTELDCQKEGIEAVVKGVVEQGIGYITNEITDDNENKIIVKGQTNLISKAGEISDLEELLWKLDEKKILKDLIDKSIIRMLKKILLEQ